MEPRIKIVMHRYTGVNLYKYYQCWSLYLLNTVTIITSYINVSDIFNQN